MWLYAVKLQKILLIEEFSLYYSNIKTSSFYTKFFKERIDKNIELKLWFQNGKVPCYINHFSFTLKYLKIKTMGDFIR